MFKQKLIITGMALVSKSPDSQDHNLIVTEVKDTIIIVDANHPVAREDIVFDLEVIAIQAY